VSSYNDYLREWHAPYMTYKTISIILYELKINLSRCVSPIAYILSACWRFTMNQRG